MKRLYCTIAALVLVFPAVYAQGWERLYPLGLGLNELFTVTPTPDGGFLATIDDTPFSFGNHALAKLDAGGSLQWVQNQQDVLGLTTPQVLPAGNNELLFFGFASDGLRLVRTNADFEVLWSKLMPLPITCSSCHLLLKPTPGGYLLCQYNTDFSPVKLVKTDSNGEVLWANTYTLGNSQNNTGMRFLLDLVSDSHGHIYLSGVEDFPYKPELVRISPEGQLIFVKTYAEPSLIYGFGSLALVNDNRIAGSCSSNIAILDSTGTVLNTIAQQAGHLTATTDGHLLVGFGLSTNLILRKITLSGAELWKKTVDLIWNLEGVYSLWELPDGGTISIGRAFTGNDYDPYVMRTDGSGNTFTNRLYGNIFADLDNNCTYSSSDDLPAGGRIVRAIKGADTWYTVTDSLGNYNLSLDSGAYLLRVQMPSDLWTPCSDSIPISLPAAQYDTVQQDIGIGSLFNCPGPEVTLSAPFLRRCLPSNYTINYANNGDVAADSATVLLVLDPYLDFQSASIPYTLVAPQEYSFYLGTLPPLSQGAFNVTVVVNCDSAGLGQTHCSTAEISVSNPCPDTGLSVPVLELEASCAGDSVAFRLRNIGGAPMTDPSEFIVIEDLIVMRQGSFQLAPQQDTLLKCPSDGSTFRMYAGFAPGESPFFSQTAAVEGCNGPATAGIWNMFPEFEAVWYDRNCQPNIGSFDPNDKQAVPTGYGPQEYIGEGVPLDYMIRFQNTGTDTAFQVVVRDTLSPWLDPASVRPGPSSHPYTWALLGQNTLEFRFNNIALPDSNVNEPGSHGFVRFRIGQKPDIPIETNIYNQAAIYFDYNAPVLTNTTHHRIGRDFITVSLWAPADIRYALRAYPNPAAEEATVALDKVPPDAALEWVLTDMAGRTLLRQHTTGGQWQLQRQGLPAGLYALQVLEGGKLLGIGKIVLR